MKLVWTEALNDKLTNLTMFRQRPVFAGLNAYPKD